MSPNGENGSSPITFVVEVADNFNSTSASSRENLPLAEHLLTVSPSPRQPPSANVFSWDLLAGPARLRMNPLQTQIVGGYDAISPIPQTYPSLSSLPPSPSPSLSSSASGFEFPPYFDGMYSSRRPRSGSASVFESPSYAQLPVQPYQRSEGASSAENLFHMMSLEGRYPNESLNQLSNRSFVTGGLDTTFHHEQTAYPSNVDSSGSMTSSHSDLPTDTIQSVAASINVLTANHRRRKRPGSFPCSIPGCNGTFTCRWSLKRHLNSHKGLRNYECANCKKCFLNAGDRNRHQKNCKVDGQSFH